MTQAHTFHIPVMGIGYTIDTPVKVAHLGIDSVISLIDDMLMEKMRRMYCTLFGLEYEEISVSADDYRAKRITSYLNLMNTLVDEKIEGLKSFTNETIGDLKKYFQLLPDTSSIRAEFFRMTAHHFDLSELRNWVNDKLHAGSIDVNIMTKVDRDNFQGKERLPREFNDAHAALRGFAKSQLHSSVVFSAGMSPRLYSYIAEFDNFFPDLEGRLQKKITLKVSDYRSALIQGKFLASKGLWVSEFRIESGLNCGGHAFASDGHLLGPVLKEFQKGREELKGQLDAILRQALEKQGKVVPRSPLPLKLSVQGGVGTAAEHRFLMDHYKLDSVGWGSPFMLVPEAVNVDSETLEKLKSATESDLFLSNISPLGVPFNSLRGNSKDIEKDKRISEGKPGSHCPKKYAALNTEFSSKSLCTASRLYQSLKIRQLEKENLAPDIHREAHSKIVEKSCICVGLGTSALIVNQLNTKVEGTGVSVCPGPNMAYFSRELRLDQMLDHIYGRENHIQRTDRPNMFIKELELYINYLKSKMDEASLSLQQSKEKYFCTYMQNLKQGIAYYQSLSGDIIYEMGVRHSDFMRELERGLERINQLHRRLHVAKCPA